MLYDCRMSPPSRFMEDTKDLENHGRSSIYGLMASCTNLPKKGLGRNREVLWSLHARSPSWGNQLIHVRVSSFTQDLYIAGQLMAQGFFQAVARPVSQGDDLFHNHVLQRIEISWTHDFEAYSCGPCPAQVFCYVPQL